VDRIFTAGNKHFLSGTERITHVGKRISAFFEMLENGFVDNRRLKAGSIFIIAHTVYGPWPGSGNAVIIEGFNRAILV
jgi:hypothetical protein